MRDPASLANLRVRADEARAALWSRVIGVHDLGVHHAIREDAAGLPTSIELFGRTCEIQVIERWRISERWWPDPIDRDYLRISGPGWLALIFRDLLAGGWFLERVYD